MPACIQHPMLRRRTDFWGMRFGRSVLTASAKTWISRYWLRMIYCNWSNDKWSVIGDGLQPQDTVSEAINHLRLTWDESCPESATVKCVKSVMMDGEATNSWAANLQTLASDFLCFQLLLSMRVSQDTSSSFLSFTHSESPLKHLQSFHGSRRDKPHQSSNATMSPSTFEFSNPSEIN